MLQREGQPLLLWECHHHDRICSNVMNCICIPSSAYRLPSRQPMLNMKQISFKYGCVCHGKDCCEAQMWTFAHCSLQNYPGNAKIHFRCLWRVEIWSTDSAKIVQCLFRKWWFTSQKERLFLSRAARKYLCDGTLPTSCSECDLWQAMQCWIPNGLPVVPAVANLMEM